MKHLGALLHRRLEELDAELDADFAHGAQCCIVVDRAELWASSQRALEALQVLSLLALLVQTYKY